MTQDEAAAAVRALEDANAPSHSSRDQATRVWPAWTTALLAAAYWAVLIAGAEMATLLAPRALCWRLLGRWESARCGTHGEAGTGFMFLSMLGGVAFFVGSSQYADWYRLYYWALYLVLLFAWAAAVAFVPALPLAGQLLVPLGTAVALKRHVDRLEADDRRRSELAATTPAP